MGFEIVLFACLLSSHFCLLVVKPLLPACRRTKSGEQALVVVSMSQHHCLHLCGANLCLCEFDSELMQSILDEHRLPCTADQMDAQRLTLNETSHHHFLVTWSLPGGSLGQHSMTMEQIMTQFPEWSVAVIDCHAQLNPAVPVDHFLRIAAISFAEGIMKKKRFQVYRHLAWATGYAEWTKLPEQLELAIKNTWSTKEEQFVGFIAPDFA